MACITAPPEINEVITKEVTTVSTYIDVIQQSLPSHGSTDDRKKLREAAQKLALALETPGDTVQRIAHITWQITTVRIANRLNLLRAIIDSTTPKSSTELAQAVRSDPLVVVRLLRYLVASGVIGESDADRYEATNITRNLIAPNLEAGINFSYTTIGPAAMALSDFLHNTEYQNPTDSKHCAFQQGHLTEDSIFQQLSKDPEELDNFNQWMTGQREGRANWLDFFPLDEVLLDGFQSAGDAGVAFVDVGGANGHEVGMIKKKFPDLPGKFVVQDLPESIKQALPIPGMQAMAHDFFTKQPIQGAKCYYLRNVPINWSDANCLTIFGHLVDAMKAGYSKLLINENVLPNKGASLSACARDMTMMAVLGAMERTEQQWRELLGKAGLRVEKIWTHGEAEGVIVAVKE